jgi:hypothetical protein
MEVPRLAGASAQAVVEDVQHAEVHAHYLVDVCEKGGVMRAGGWCTLRLEVSWLRIHK